MGVDFSPQAFGVGVGQGGQEVAFVEGAESRGFLITPQGKDALAKT